MTVYWSSFRQTSQLNSPLNRLPAQENVFTSRTATAQLARDAACSMHMHHVRENKMWPCIEHRQFQIVEGTSFQNSLLRLAILLPVGG